MKLFLVTCRGMQSSRDGTAFVVAVNSDDACNQVWLHLVAHSLGFPEERGLLTAELLADETRYSESERMLYLPPGEVAKR